MSFMIRDFQNGPGFLSCRLKLYTTFSPFPLLHAPNLGVSERFSLPLHFPIWSTLTGLEEARQWGVNCVIFQEFVWRSRPWILGLVACSSGQGDSQLVIPFPLLASVFSDMTAEAWNLIPWAWAKFSISHLSSFCLFLMARLGCSSPFVSTVLLFS